MSWPIVRDPSTASKYITVPDSTTFPSGTDPWSSAANTSYPQSSSTFLNEGFTPGNRIGAEHINWIFNTTGKVAEKTGQGSLNLTNYLATVGSVSREVEWLPGIGLFVIFSYTGTNAAMNYVVGGITSGTGVSVSYTSIGQSSTAGDAIIRTAAGRLYNAATAPTAFNLDAWCGFVYDGTTYKYFRPNAPKFLGGDPAISTATENTADDAGGGTPGTFSFKLYAGNDHQVYPSEIVFDRFFRTWIRTAISTTNSATAVPQIRHDDGNTTGTITLPTYDTSAKVHQSHIACDHAGNLLCDFGRPGNMWTCSGTLATWTKVTPVGLGSATKLYGLAYNKAWGKWLCLAGTDSISFPATFVTQLYSSSDRTNWTSVGLHGSQSYYSIINQGPIVGAASNLNGDFGSYINLSATELTPPNSDARFNRLQYYKGLRIKNFETFSAILLDSTTGQFALTSNYEEI